jgi:hypothetical protein
MNISILAKTITEFKKNNNNELELRYTDKISKEDFFKIIDYYKNKQLKLEQSTTLDVSFLNKRINYRITLENDNIDKYSSTNKIELSMIKEFLNKQKNIKIKPIIDDDYKLKFNLKEEIIITDEDLQKELLKSLQKNLKDFRYKTRYSFISKNQIYRYDFTIVHSDLKNKKFSKSSILATEEDYELEIEIINRNKITNSTTIADEFHNLGIELFNIINKSEAPIEEDDDEERDEIPTKASWVLPNRIGYNEKIIKTFKPENYQKQEKAVCECKDDICDIADKSISLFPQQRLIKDYIQFDSPYRGALLYHELGSGKSGASIAAAEGYINKKKMFVLSPASLAVNYENEIYKISSIGLNLKKDWSLIKIGKTDKTALDILKKKYAIDKSIIKKDGLIWIPLYENDISSAIVVKTSPTKEDKPNIDLMISHIIRNRYTFISYNGLTANLIKSLGKSPFDNSFIIIDEIHNFSSRIVNGSKLAREIYTHIMNAKDCKIILLSGTPIINNPYEIATIINLIRGYMNVYELNYGKGSKHLTTEEVVNKIKAKGIFNVIDEFYIDNENNKIHISFLPENYKKEERTIIKKNKWNSTIQQYLQNIIKSLNEIAEVKLLPTYNTSVFSALPNTKEEFDLFFIDNSDEENPKVKNQDLFIRRILGTLSYYSISGSDLFPTRLPDIIRNITMCDNQFKKYLDVRTIERKMETAKRGLFDDKTSVYRAFSRMVCNFSFPEEIERLYPNDIKKAINKEIDNDESENSSKSSENEKDKPKIVDLYEQKLKTAIATLKQDDYLSYERVKNELSPKFAQMYDDILSSPGSVLLYSQFRSVEGIGIFCDFLSKNGFKEIDIKKVDGKFYLTDEDIFDEKYDDKRYVIFNQDKEKTKYLMNLFNGDFKNLPQEIVDALPEDVNQSYGKLVKLFCITASGAEGISLKNVRRVLITEPYWNNIRIDQVIGRAIRSCSHETLPLKDRNVEVYRYIMNFTKKQIEMNYSIQTLDKALTTDEHILLMANKKMAIINQFLQMLKSSSFDCIINAIQNKPLMNGYKCYSWAIGINKDDLSYTANIKDDYKIMKHKKYQIAKKGRGRVIMKNGNKYILLDDKIYNYHSYKHAGILIEEEI